MDRITRGLGGRGAQALIVSPVGVVFTCQVEETTSAP
jgi:hypothetical protein